MKKHILVISQYFYPEQFRINDICLEWVKRGYKVTVLTGIPNYPQGKYYKGYGIFKKRKEIYKGIEIIRIPILPRGSKSISLSLNYLSFVFSGFFWKMFTKVKADLVFIFEVSPMTQALPGIWYSKKKKIPCYLYVQDLWPENFELLSGIKNKFIIKLIGRMVDYIYSHCTKIFTTSRSFITSIANRGVPIEKIQYWPQYAEDFYTPQKRQTIKEIPENNKFNIVFTGNIGYSQGLDVLPQAANIIKNQNISINIMFNIIGDGRYKIDLVRLVKLLNVEDMFNFIPKQPAEKIPHFLAACDLAFLSLADNPIFSKTIPAKLQSYMACAIPIIACATGETSNIIKESGAGVCVTPNNAEKLAEEIIKLANKDKEDLIKLGKNGRRYYELNFNKNNLLNIMDEYFSFEL